jgi:serine/threonine protein kinase
MPVTVKPDMLLRLSLITGHSFRLSLQEIDELYKIFMKLGTPDENMWAGVRNLPDWKETFPKWRPSSMQQICPNLEPLGLDLLQRMLVYDPQLRITAKNALNHPYFHDIQDLIQQHNSGAMPLHFGG